MRNAHQDLRDHKCDHCEKAFHNKQRLERHINSQHTKSKLWPCPVCHSKYDRCSEQILKKEKKFGFFHLHVHPVCNGFKKLSLFELVDNTNIFKESLSDSSSYGLFSICNVCYCSFAMGFLITILYFRKDNLRTHIRKNHSGVVNVDTVELVPIENEAGFDLVNRKPRNSAAPSQIISQV